MPVNNPYATSSCALAGRQIAICHNADRTMLVCRRRADSSFSQGLERQELIASSLQCSKCGTACVFRCSSHNPRCCDHCGSEASASHPMCASCPITHGGIPRSDGNACSARNIKKELLDLVRLDPSKGAFNAQPRSTSVISAALLLPMTAAGAAPPSVLQRGYDAGVSGANLAETTLNSVERHSGHVRPRVQAAGGR